MKYTSNIKSFREIVLESFKDPVFKQRGFGSLILTDKLLNALEQKAKTYKALRVIGDFHIKDIDRTISRKGGVSAFTNSSNYYSTLKGMQKNGGVLLELEGKVLFSAALDLETDVDVENVKYIPVRSLSIWKNSEKLQKLLTEYCNSFYAKAFEIMNIDAKVNFSVKDMIQQNYIGAITQLTADTSDSQKEELISYSTKLMDKIISDNLDYIVNLLQDEMAVKSLIKSEYSQFDWNEIIMLKPKVKTVYLIKDILDDVKSSKDKLGNKYKDVKIINSKDLGKIIDKIKRENLKR